MSHSDARYKSEEISPYVGSLAAKLHDFISCSTHLFLLEKLDIFVFIVYMLSLAVCLMVFYAPFSFCRQWFVNFPENYSEIRSCNQDIWNYSQLRYLHQKILIEIFATILNWDICLKKCLSRYLQLFSTEIFASKIFAGHFREALVETGTMSPWFRFPP